MSLFQGVIEKRVMQVVRGRIATAEKAYLENCKALEKQLEADKTAAAERLVNDVLALHV